MTIQCGCAEQPPQILTSELDGKIVIDLETFRQLKTAVGQCVDNLSRMKISEIFIEAADTYLIELESNEISKALLLLSSWLKEVPDKTEETLEELETAYGVMNLIVSASKLGGCND